MKKTITDYEYLDYLRIQSDTKEIEFKMALAIEQKQNELNCKRDKAVDLVIPSYEQIALHIRNRKIRFWHEIRERYELEPLLNYSVNNDKELFLTDEKDLWIQK